MNIALITRNEERNLLMDQSGNHNQMMKVLFSKKDSTTWCYHGYPILSRLNLLKA